MTRDATKSWDTNPDPLAQSDISFDTVNMRLQTPGFISVIGNALPTSNACNF